MPMLSKQAVARGMRRLAVLCLGWRLAVALAGAAVAPVTGGTGGEASVAINADKIEFERENNLVRAEGNVRIQQGDDRLEADRVVFHTGTQQAHAVGNVVFRRDDLEWRGQRFAYNFGTRRWASGQFTAFIDPFHVASDAAEYISEDEFGMTQATVTTCELPGDHAHYRLRARRVQIRPEHRLVARHATLWMGQVPVFYLPVWRASLDPDFGFRFQPGYRGRMGYFLLSSYRYRIDPVWRGETHLDYRSRRGVAVGQDLRWNDPVAGAFTGEAAAYVINDRDPAIGKAPETADIDTPRYRLQFRHRTHWTYRDALQTRLEYVGDAYVREDFFERDYRRAVQPDNFVSYIHRRDELAFGLLARMRLNDFYEHVDRLPEASLDIHRRRIADSPLYYESRTLASVLRHQWPETHDRESVDVNRIDSRHLVTWPVRAMGFLSLIPRAGGRATWYSRTFSEALVEQTVTRTVTNAVVTDAGETSEVVVVESTTRTNSVMREAGSDVRTLIELGIEASFQASRIWETGPRPWGRDLRHVVEPYLNYTLIPEPSLTPERLHRFDDIDRLGEMHAIGFGVRNVLQTKREQRSHDLLDVNVFSAYRLNASGDEEALGAVGVRAEARPADHWGMDLTASYDPGRSTLDELNLRWHFRHDDQWRIDLDYRYRFEQSRLIAGTLAVRPGSPWAFELYGRYEAETAHLEEHAWTVERNLDCMVVRTGFSHLPAFTRADGSEREDEYRVTMEIWLTAFPEMRTGVSRRH